MSNKGWPEEKTPGKYGISICPVFDLSDARYMPIL